jgi:hypothetical protein
MRHDRSAQGDRRDRTGLRNQSVRAAYDLKKMRGKQMVGRMEKTRRYGPIREGLRVITALLMLRNKVLQPLLAAAKQLRPSHGAQNPAPIDPLTVIIRPSGLGMGGVFHAFMS